MAQRNKCLWVDMSFTLKHYPDYNQISLWFDPTETRTHDLLQLRRVC